MKKTEAARAKYLAQKKAYRDKNKDKIRAYNKVWKAKQKAKQAVQATALSGKNEVLKALRVAQQGASKKLTTLKEKQAMKKVQPKKVAVATAPKPKVAPVRFKEFHFSSEEDFRMAVEMQKFTEYSPPTVEDLQKVTKEDLQQFEKEFPLTTNWRAKDVKHYSEKLTWQLYTAMGAVRGAASKESLLKTVWETVCDLSATASEARQFLADPLKTTPSNQEKPIK